MNDEHTLPELNESTVPSDYAYNLRNMLFPTLRDVEADIPVHFATVAEYEKLGGTRPPIGYLACLARLLVAQKTSNLALNPGEIERYKARIVEQIRDLMLRKQGRKVFRNSGVIQNWGMLEAAADEFIKKQQARRNSVSQSSTQEAPLTSGPIIQKTSAPFMAPPLPPQGLIGRERDLRKIRELLAFTQLTVTEVPPLALKGMGGVGKSTLAAAVGRAQDIQAFFPDGIFWVELGPAPDARLLMNAWGRSLGLDLAAEWDDQACEVRLREAFFHSRALLIVDDVWHISHGQHFMVGGPYCRTLLTTRELPVAYALATCERTIRVEVLSLQAAMTLLEKFAPEAVANDASIAERLCHRLECLPLALKLTGRLLANEADVPSRMRRVLDELTEHREARLNLLQAEGDSRVDAAQSARSSHSLAESGISYGEGHSVSLQSILGMSVKRLSQKDQVRFALLATLRHEPLIWELGVAQAAWNCSIAEAEETLSHLVQRGLIEPRSGDQYWMHALLADYAAEMLDEREF